ncbi:carboxypeptidase M32 [Bacillus sp. AGMB 02131]|uniref:Metal-dependent carboxypeptidase n=1 Tax=Peribacillus faecalis TaxID=2772559 RepID=A0A927D3J4_9BACI|nr:carboxypeptidase M32 [Peribacillus faecalis]MBD3110444.1 carboxypeptidase M32 [Peribacillus faecalis]
MTVKTIEKDFLDFVQKMTAYNEALALIYWDLRTGAPKKGVDQRSVVIGQLSSEVFAMSVSGEMGYYIQALTEEDTWNYLSLTTQKLVEDCQKEYDRNKKIPAEEYKDYTMLTTKAESVWEEAKEKSDFAMFQPYLEKIVDYNRKFIEYWGYEGNKYNTLLDIYEPGMTVEILDSVFGKLRNEIVPMVKKIAESKHKPEVDFLFNHFPKEQQKDFSLKILEQLQYDFDAGRLDETVHPFEITINANDVRITTKYDENDFRTAVFGTIHECGHAIYEQNISKELMGTTLASGTSMGIHESQSLFFENFIGRSFSFWKSNYPELQKTAPEQFGNVKLEDYYRAINESKPSLIRIEADELTYPLHVMVRYEIEKALINNEIEVADLPKVWNEKYKEYLGIEPTNDGEGVLQDVHWAGGSFGYFPSYALGYMYAAQWKNAMLKDLPNYDELLAEGNVAPVKEWLSENIHQYGKLKKPLELLQDITGEGLNVDYLIRYLQEKYSDIYKLS